MSEEKKSKGLFGAFRNAVSAVTEKVQEIKIPESIQGAMNTVQEKVQEAKLDEKFQGAISSVREQVAGIRLPEVKLTVKPREEKDPDAEEAAAAGRKITALSVRCALQIVYYMMAADGEIFHHEEEKYDEIGMELDPDYKDKKENIIATCKTQMMKSADPDEYEEVLRDGIEKAIQAGANTQNAVIAPKVLIWDLMTIAFSDGQYNEKERKLLRYIARKLDIEKEILLELENSFLAIQDLENELAWIKTTDRPYLTIETVVNEIADRKNVIFEGVKDLISR